MQCIGYYPCTLSCFLAVIPRTFTTNAVLSWHTSVLCSALQWNFTCHLCLGFPPLLLLTFCYRMADIAAEGWSETSKIFFPQKVCDIPKYASGLIIVFMYPVCISQTMPYMVILQKCLWNTGYLGVLWKVNTSAFLLGEAFWIHLLMARSNFFFATLLHL